MITQEKDVEIRMLARQGKGIREISRIMGISRNTVRRYLRSAAWAGYKTRTGKPGKLDPFKRYLEERVEAAKPHRLPAPEKWLGLFGPPSGIFKVDKLTDHAASERT